MVAGCSQYGQHSTFITLPNTIQGRARSICSVLHSWPSHLKRACPTVEAGQEPSRLRDDRPRVSGTSDGSCTAGKSNRTWNIAYSARCPLCNWAHPDDGAPWPSTDVRGNHETHEKPEENSRRCTALRRRTRTGPIVYSGSVIRN